MKMKPLVEINGICLCVDNISYLKPDLYDKKRTAVHTKQGDPFMVEAPYLEVINLINSALKKDKS